ncbi:MAG: ArnT family glycosyltransferase [Candidatus Levyibacteriota bacterium]
MLNLLRSIIKKENIPIILVLFLAAFMRFYRIGAYLTFLGDEGRDVLVAMHILRGDLTLLGPTASVGGFFLGPIYYYFMAPFLWLFNYNPVGPAVMVALVGIATVWLVYQITKDNFGYIPALIASLLYAISPLVITYSRSSWNPNVVPFFSLLMMYLLSHAVMNKSVPKLMLAGVLFGILLQLHYLSTFLGVVVFFYLLATTFVQTKTQLSHRILTLLMRYVLFALGTLVGWSPFLAFEVRHGFPNIRSILTFVFTSGDTGNNTKFMATAQDVFLRIFGRLLLSFPKPEDMHFFSSNIISIWSLAAYLIGIGSLVYIIIKIVHSYRKKEKNMYFSLLLVLWLMLTVFLFGFYKKSIYDYYLGIVFPVPFILLASLLSPLLKKGRIVVVSVLVLVAFGIWLNIYFRPITFPQDYIGYNPSLFNTLFSYPRTSTPNDQLKQVQDISEFVLAKTGGKPYNFAVISSGGNSDFAYRFFFERVNKPPVTIQFPGADPERKTITDQLLIVCESVPCHPLGYPLWEVAGFGQAEIAGEWNVSVLKVYRLIHIAKSLTCSPGKTCDF